MHKQQQRGWKSDFYSLVNDDDENKCKWTIGIFGRGLRSGQLNHENLTVMRRKRTQTNLAINPKVILWQLIWCSRLWCPFHFTFTGLLHNSIFFASFSLHFSLILFFIFYFKLFLSLNFSVMEELKFIRILRWNSLDVDVLFGVFITYFYYLNY